MSPCSLSCSGWAGNGQEAVPAIHEHLPDTPTFLSWYFSTSGTVNERKEREYLESHGSDSRSGSHTLQHHGDCQSTGKEETSERVRLKFLHDLLLHKAALTASKFQTN